jgi:hypothetical protein
VLAVVIARQFGDVNPDKCQFVDGIEQLDVRRQDRLSSCATNRMSEPSSLAARKSKFPLDRRTSTGTEDNSAATPAAWVSSVIFLRTVHALSHHAWADNGKRNARRKIAERRFMEGSIEPWLALTKTASVRDGCGMR